MTYKQIAKIEARIDAGIKWLNENYGKDWYKKINLEDVDISDSEDCILGQLYGEWGDVVCGSDSPDMPELSYYESDAFGFSEKASDASVVGDVLNGLWFMKIYQLMKKEDVRKTKAKQV